MAEPSLGLHKASVGYILYYIIGHPTSSTKNLNKCMTDKDVQAIIQISIDLRFEIKDLLNELKNELTILGKYESLHQICHDIIISFFQIF
jgi:hypothetical protein